MIMTAQTTQTKSAGYKRTEVGMIPDDWEVKSLEELFSFSGGFTASREQLSDDGFCYLHYGDIHKSNKTYIDVQEEFPKIPKLKILLNLIPKKSLLNDGDVVFVDASEDDEGASKHIVVRNSKDIVYISGLHTIVSKSKDDSLENKYKQYCFQTNDVKRQFKFYAVGTKVSGISKTNIARIFIPYPPKFEQAVIASVLSDVDALVSSLERLIAKKRAIKQGAMQELLTGKRRLSGFSGEWKVTLLGEVASVLKGTQLHSSETNLNGKFAHLNGGTTPSGYTHKSNTPENTIAISEGGNSCGYVQFMADSYWCGGHCYSVIPNGIENRFLYHALKGQQSAIMGLRVGSGLPNVQKTTLLAFKFLYPATETEQTAIATILSDMDVEIEALEQKLAKYRLLKRGMMQVLLTGKIRLV